VLIDAMNSAHLRCTAFEEGVKPYGFIAEPVGTLLPNQLSIYNFLNSVSHMKSTESLRHSRVERAPWGSPTGPRQSTRNCVCVQWPRSVDYRSTNFCC
jgi:hypothetical protein